EIVKHFSVQFLGIVVRSKGLLVVSTVCAEHACLAEWNIAMQINHFRRMVVEVDRRGNHVNASVGLVLSRQAGVNFFQFPELCEEYVKVVPTVIDKSASRNVLSSTIYPTHSLCVAVYG